MSSAANAVATPRTIRATIRYVVKGEKAIFYPADREKSYWPPDDHEMTITDARPLKDRLTVDRNGFALLDHRTKVTDFFDEKQVEEIYAPEILEIAKRLNGAVHAFAFGPVARTDDPSSRQGRLPSFGAHVDYGRRTVEEITRDTLGAAEAERWLAKRVVLMNFWKPITPVFSSPLALCDASTVEPGDMHDSEVRGGLMDPDRPPLYGYNLSHNPRHRWYYVPRMQPHELFAFKLYDSDASRPQWTGHTAIVDPDTPPGAPPRQSIEIRTISFIEH
jgi:hypothetical protein